MPDPTGRVSHLPEMHRGVAWKEPCRAATTANITISTDLNNGDTLDGITLATGDRVLVKNQSTGSQNGIYVVGVTPTRAYDMDQDATTSVPASEVMGAFIYVIAGMANGGKVFYSTNTTAPVIGTDSLTFAQFSGSAGSVATDPIWDAKGDLAAATGADAAVRVPVGSNDTILMADSAQTAGLKWVASQTPVTQASNDVAAEGTADTYARGDHRHGMPTIGSGSVATDPIWDAKGDLAGGTGADTAARLAVGANDTILMADSSQTTGLKWVAPATPSTQAFGDAAAEGTADTFTRGDHKHGLPATIIGTDTFWDAKGDLAGGTGSNAASRLPVGTNGDVLTADSSQTTGMKWAGFSAVDPEGWTSIIKSADQDVTNNTNQDDTELQFATTAGKRYMIECYLVVSGNDTTGDFNGRFSVAAGTIAGRGHFVSTDTGLSYQASNIAASAGASTGGMAIGVPADLTFPTSLLIRVALTVSNTTTLKFQFGNNAASAGRTSRVMKGSILRYRQAD